MWVASTLSSMLNGQTVPSPTGTGTVPQCAVSVATLPGTAQQYLIINAFVPVDAAQLAAGGKIWNLAAAVSAGTPAAGWTSN